MKNFQLILISLLFLAIKTGAEEAPAKSVEAWCMMFQGLDQVRDAMASGELTRIHNEDMVFNIAVSTLLREIQIVSPEKQNDAQVALASFGREMGNLHAAADANDVAKVQTILPAILQSFETIKTYYQADTLNAGKALADRYTCPMHADVIGKKGSLCPKCGMPLDQLIRPAPFQPGAVLMPMQTILATVSLPAPLKPNQEANVLLHLNRIFGQEPVTLNDLREVHTQKIHLLIIDQSLTDYHHIHPTASDMPGQYNFRFTPKKPGSYRMWADIRPIATGFQEYARADIPGDGTAETLNDKRPSLTSNRDGFGFKLSFAEFPILAGKPISGKLQVSDRRGKPFKQLEPIMGAYAHLVGFYEDSKTVLHIHPKTDGTVDPESRGGPDLEFTFYAPIPGFVRFFSEVQIGSESKIAPFGIQVLSGEEK